MLRVVALVVLTLVAGNVCWAKPNHAFSYCQQPRRFFLRRAARSGAAGARVRAAVERARIARIARTNFDRIAETQAWRGFQRVRVFLFRAPMDARARSPTPRTRSRRPVPEEKIPFRRRRRFRVAQARMRESAQTFFRRRRPLVGRSRPRAASARGVGGCARRHRRARSLRARRTRRAPTAGMRRRVRARSSAARERRGDGPRRMSRVCRSARASRRRHARETLRESGGRMRRAAATARRRARFGRDGGGGARHRDGSAAAANARAGDAGAVVRARSRRHGERARRRAGARRRRGFFPSEIDARAKTHPRATASAGAGIGSREAGADAVRRRPRQSSKPARTQRARAATLGRRQQRAAQCHLVFAFRDRAARRASPFAASRRRASGTFTVRRGTSAPSPRRDRRRTPTVGKVRATRGTRPGRDGKAATTAPDRDAVRKAGARPPHRARRRGARSPGIAARKTKRGASPGAASRSGPALPVGPWPTRRPGGRISGRLLRAARRSRRARAAR